MVLIRRATVYDIPEIIEILSLTYDNLEGMEYQLSMELKNKNYYTFYLDNDNSTFISVERIGNYKAQLHIYTKKGSGGKRLKRVCKEIVEDIKKTHNYTSLLIFVPEDNVAGRIMAMNGGMDRIGEIKDADGLNRNEILYSISIGENYV
ncbi:MAG: DUF2824 family protein [Anaerovoracaceae bacterium]